VHITQLHLYFTWSMSHYTTVGKCLLYFQLPQVGLFCFAGYLYINKQVLTLISIPLRERGACVRPSSKELVRHFNYAVPVSQTPFEFPWLYPTKPGARSAQIIEKGNTRLAGSGGCAAKQKSKKSVCACRANMLQ
jgi:hypothetical protein